MYALAAHAPDTIPRGGMLMSISAFLSHSHEDRKLASALKTEFSRYGIDTFIAHEDLAPSVEWEKHILQMLKKCKVFFALITENFVRSDWTDQETGFALAHGKAIVPLSTGITPYGFIGRFQAQKIREPLSEACWNVVRALTKHSKIGRAVRLGAIDRFLESHSFESANTFAPNLAELEPFSHDELTRIVKGSIQNSQIYGGFRARDVVRKLIREQAQLVDAKLTKTFEKLVADNS
jgi:hypothetical protein